MDDGRKIIHIDMDAFFASVEQRDFPAYRGKPIAVGGLGSRGVVAAASYEARRYGVRSAMSSAKARTLCPQLVFVAPRFDVYKSVSAQMHDIFHEYTDIIEPISIDEAFLDVTENKKGISLAVTIAREIKSKIKERLSLTASAGVSYNKFLAKIASDLRKPDGLATIHPSIALRFIESLKIEDFWGVGPVTAGKFHKLNIFNGADLRKCSLDFLMHNFGKSGAILYQFARGIDLRPVEKFSIRKSLGCEHTYPSDLIHQVELSDALEELSVDLCQRLEKKKFKGHTLTLKVKFDDFSSRSRSCFVSTSDIFSSEIILLKAEELLANLGCGGRAVRLLGLTVSNPVENKSRLQSKAFYDPRQLLFDFD